ncbi:hypothetical protein ACHAPI_008339 [Fusarium lateritium]
MSRRFEAAFNNVEKNMSPNLAEELAYSTLEKLASMDLYAAWDITECPTYQALEKALASEKSISFPDWFFLASVYGPDHAALRPYQD